MVKKSLLEKAFVEKKPFTKNSSIKHISVKTARAWGQSVDKANKRQTYNLLK